MAITYGISQARDLAVFRWTGIVSLTEYFAALDAYVSDPDYAFGRNELVDLSGLEDFSTDFAGMSSAIQQANVQYQSHVVPSLTVIWSPNESVFGLARMMQQLAEVNPGIKVDVYREEADALTALELSDASVADLIETTELMSGGAPWRG